MAEEFQESQVIFPDDSDDSCFDFRDTTTHVKSLAKSRSKSKKVASSLPVNIPADHRRHHHHHHRVIFSARFGDDKDADQCQLEEDEEEEWEEGELVPPHVIVGRRIAGKMAFSVFTGNGRTLKGRDLSQVRNSILRMTGFLET
ncbi:hypothetical protein FNV43_RR05906 [Rhamnella rubrinervis]|uniref:Senescence regulator n=1 Tax=Rhamnella rubrinervis TaxID=2594499 RepID=A0A8K0MKZ7_9ROSA|nr:hypothetical protein FNV43_RR05906 [Rhamnella rubrinervis]